MEPHNPDTNSGISALATPKTLEGAGPNSQPSSLHKTKKRYGDEIKRRPKDRKAVEAQALVASVISKSPQKTNPNLV